MLNKRIIHLPELSIGEDSLKTYLEETYNIRIQESMENKLKQAIKEEIKLVLKEDSRRPITYAPNKWFDSNPEDLMTRIYWMQRQLPPIDATRWTVQWQSIAKQLNSKFPAPSNKRYLLTFKHGDKVK